MGLFAAVVCTALLSVSCGSDDQPPASQVKAALLGIATELDLIRDPPGVQTDFGMRTECDGFDARPPSIWFTFDMVDGGKAGLEARLESAGWQPR